jgi:hypothetical protein
MFIVFIFNSKPRRQTSSTCLVVVQKLSSDASFGVPFGAQDASTMDAMLIARGITIGRQGLDGELKAGVKTG